MSNVYSKLQEARVKLQKIDMKKSGKNAFAKFNYFELQDFLPHVNDIFNELKLFSQVNFHEGLATMTIINTEKTDEQIVFTCPTSDAGVKGANPMQALGAQQTYARRYLYLNALEIVENDLSDAMIGSKTEIIGNDKRQKLYKLASVKGVSANEVKALIKKETGLDIAYISEIQYNAYYERINKKANKESK